MKIGEFTFVCFIVTFTRPGHKIQEIYTYRNSVIFNKSLK